MTALRITADRAEMDVALIHRFLSQESTWARDIPLSTVRRGLPVGKSGEARSSLPINEGRIF